MDIILSDDLVRLLGIEINEGIYVSEFMGVPLLDGEVGGLRYTKGYILVNLWMFPYEMERLGEYSWVLPNLNSWEGVNDI